MEGIPPPHGYKCYDETNPIHVQYGFDIPLEDRTHKPPHFICFQFNTNNQLHHYPSHTITVTRKGVTGLDYGEPLVTKLPPYHPLPKPLVDDQDLIILAAVNADSQAIDIAMTALDDSGLSADVDHLRRLVESCTDLQQQAQVLERKQRNLRSHDTEVTARLISTRARSCLHPYLQGSAIIHNSCNQAQCTASSGVPLADVLNDVIPMPPSWNESPHLFNDSRSTDISQWVRFAKRGTVQCHPTPPPPNKVKTTLIGNYAPYRCTLCGPTSHPPFKCPRCMYCGKVGHHHQSCWYPHTHCYLSTTCIVPEVHQYGKTQQPCPYSYKHGVDADTDMFRDSSVYDDVDWEAEDRGD
jgi:hypothetical protein